MQESQTPLLASRNVAAVRRPKNRTRDEDKSLRSVTAHRLSPPAARPQPVRARPRVSSRGPSKSVVPRNCSRPQSHPRARAIQRPFPHGRVMRGTPRAERATAAFQDCASTALRRCSRPPEDAAEPFHLTEIVQPLRQGGSRLPAIVR